MRVVPERSPWTQVATVVAAFIGGPWVGLQLGIRLAPGSDVVHGLSVAAFGAVFVGGLLLWMGLGIAVAAVRFVASLVRGRRPGPDDLGVDDRVVPPGYRAFIVLGGGLGAVVGLVAGLLSDLSVAAGVGIWAGTGLAYGFALWGAARHGYLPFPEPE